jgi:hypothetical protein
MIPNEETVRFLEEHIPELAEAAVKQAYWNALASGSSVLMCENDNLIEIHPDGTRKFIKKLPPSTPVKKFKVTI